MPNITFVMLRPDVFEKTLHLRSNYAEVCSRGSNGQQNNKSGLVHVTILRRTGHDDVIKWEHSPRNWSFVRGIHRRFDVFFDLRLNKRLSKQSWGWWFETLSRPLWGHCNGWPANFHSSDDLEAEMPHQAEMCNALDWYDCEGSCWKFHFPLQWRHNERDGVSNHQPCLSATGDHLNPRAVCD